MQRLRDRSGQGLIGLLVTVVIIGILWKKGMFLPKPASKDALAPALQTVPDQARTGSIKMAANQVKSALAQYQMNKPGLPKDLDELHRETGLDLMKDPWGGQYYIQQGYLRCTGNPKAFEKVW